MIKITKHREVRPGLKSCWRLYANGEPSKLFIEMAVERPKFGQTQSYDLCHDDYGFVTDGSVWGLVRIANFLANPLLSKDELGFTD